MGKYQKTLKDWCIENNKEYILNEWDYEKNINISPDKIGHKSCQNVLWICAKGHSWVATPNSRLANSNCPVCGNRKVLVGYNDLNTTHPEISKFWHPTKNGNVTPQDVTAGSPKNFWWKCEFNHEWQNSLERTTKIKGNICPYCSNRKILSGYNDLLTTHPQIAKDWDYNKNGDLKPDQIGAQYHKKVWWKCSRGHERYIMPRLRVESRGCPICSKQKNKSLPEYIIYFFLSQKEKVIHNYTDLGFELDLYIPSKKIGIEYDGSRYHTNKEQKDIEKNKLCQDLGIILYRFREEPLSSLESSSIDISVTSDYKSLSQAISSPMQFIYKENFIIDIDSNLDKINNLRNTEEIKNSFAALYPEQAAEWHPTKNGNLKPTDIPPFANHKAWFKCKNGHEWVSKIGNRTFRNCPYCAGQRIIPGENDLESQFPQVAEEWNYQKNLNLSPNKVTAKNNKKVWWKCKKCEYEWKTEISHRTLDNTGCPVCAGKKVKPGYNDLATTHPHLAAEWHPTKNSTLSPTNVTFGSDKKVWWKCSKGHEWEAVIQHRSHSSGCPICSNKSFYPGQNDLLTLYPDLSKEWNFDKNKDLKPSDVIAGSNKKVWWKCSHGHEWEATIGSRTKQGVGCPVCANKRVLTGYNDLETINPILAAQWHPVKNGELIPSNITANSGKKAWWLCPTCNYEWESVVGSRNKGVGCPCCSGHVLVEGINDVATLFPDIKKYWDYDRNHDLRLKPEMFKISSKEKAYFIFDGKSVESKIHNAVIRIRNIKKRS